MDKFRLRTFLIYILVIAYVVSNVIAQLNGLSPRYQIYVNPVIWFLIFVYAIYINYVEKKRFKAKTEKAQTVLIIVMAYLIIYYFLGLFIGYAKSPYNHDIIPFLKNLWAYSVIIVFEEYTRESMLPLSKKNWIVYLIIMIIFSALEINFHNFSSNFIDFESTFKFVGGTVIPVFFRNCLLTYLCTVGSHYSSLSYRLPISITTLVIPLFPDIEWFWNAILELLLIIVIYFKLNYIHDKKTSKESVRKLKRQKLINQVPWLVTLLLLVLFVTGVFKYYPVAVMSNSMVNVFYRGDTVIIEKVKDKSTLKLNDIVQYKLDNSSVMHRIIKIEKKGNEIVYTTKGDNNQKPDLKKVKEEQIVGKVLIRIPKIGYPSVFFKEFMDNTRPNVETGD